MIVEHLNKLQQAEKLSKVVSISRGEPIAYKRFGNAWVRADKPLNEIFSKSLKYSELLFYPNLNYKAWALFFLTKLRLKKGDHKLKKLLGLKVKWNSLEVIYLALEADIIYYRYHAAVMVYSSLSQKRVLKVALSKLGEKTMMDEAKSQRLAKNINTGSIYIPTVLKEFHIENLDFLVEEYFVGKSQSFRKKRRLKANYHKVFQFLLKFYLINPIELQSLSECKFLNHLFVENFIKELQDGEQVISFYHSLYAKDKKMIFVRIHGDLNHTNILSNKEHVCLIDWGKSKHHYLARDLDNSSYNTEEVYKEFLELAEIDNSMIYSYAEQIFLTRYIEMNRLIHDGIVRNTITPHLYKWTKNQNRQLLLMSRNLSKLIQ